MKNNTTPGPAAPNQLDHRDALIAAKAAVFTDEAREAAGELDPLPNTLLVLGEGDDVHDVKVLLPNSIQDIRARSLRPA